MRMGSLLFRFFRYVLASVMGGAAFGLIVVAATTDVVPHDIVPTAHTDLSPVTEAVKESEMVVSSTLPVVPAPTPENRYIEVISGCNAHYEGDCATVHSGPGEAYPTVFELRTGVVLAVSDIVLSGGRTWYRVIFDEHVRYPNRISNVWYVSNEFTRMFTDVGHVPHV